MSLEHNFLVIDKKKDSLNRKNWLIIDRTQAEIWVYAISLFFLTQPYFIWHKIPLSIFISICVILSANHLQIHFRTIGLSVFLTCLYIFLAFRSDVNIIGLIVILLYCVLFFSDQLFLKKIFDAYLVVFSITIIPSLIVHFLLLLGISLPFNTLEPLNIIKTSFYNQYPFLVVYHDISSFVFPRFFGYYDEPGVVGTIAGVMLFVKGFNLKEKINIPLFIAGIMSFSLFFYIMVIVHVIAFTRTKYKIILLVFIALILSTLLNNEILYNIIFKRFEFSDKGLAGNNRESDYFANWFESFKQSDSFYWGLGKGASGKYNYGGSSYKSIIVNFGIIFFLFYMGSFIIFALSHLRFTYKLFMYLIILFGVIYQRPFITNFIYIFLIFVPIYALDEKKLF